MNATRTIALALIAGAIAISPAMAQKSSKPAKAPAKAAKPAAKPAAAAKKSAKKAPSPCAGLSQSACKGNKSCGWIVPKKKVSSNGRKLKAYCRLVAGIAKKKRK